jgi:hypothetical protein
MDDTERAPEEQHSEEVDNAHLLEAFEREESTVLGGPLPVSRRPGYGLLPWFVVGLTSVVLSLAAVITVLGQPLWALAAVLTALTGLIGALRWWMRRD